MKNLITLILLALTPFCLFAQDVDITQMSQQELINYQKGLQVAQKVTDTSEIMDADSIDKYLKIGEALKAVGEGLGEGGDAFMQSTSGKIVVTAVIWKIMGRDLLTIFDKFIGVVIGISFFIIVGGIWYKFTRKAFCGYTTLEKISGNFWNRSKEYETHDSSCSFSNENDVIIYSLMFLIIIGIACLMIFV